MSEQLLPCPHCGSHAREGFSDDTEYYGPEAWIECPCCECVMSDDSKETVRQMWNRRASPWISVNRSDIRPRDGQTVFVLYEGGGAGCTVWTDMILRKGAEYWMPIPPLEEK